MCWQKREQENKLAGKQMSKPAGKLTSMQANELSAIKLVNALRGAKRKK